VQTQLIPILNQHLALHYSTVGSPRAVRLPLAVTMVLTLALLPLGVPMKVPMKGPKEVPMKVLMKVLTEDPTKALTEAVMVRLLPPALLALTKGLRVMLACR
jgi:hypothetical protein